MLVFRSGIRAFYPRLHLARWNSGGSSQLGELGSGAGKGGGGGGSIRSAGGAFGKMQAAREEEYFYKKQLEQLERLKNDDINQAEYHHQQIKEHEEAIRRHKEFLENMHHK